MAIERPAEPVSNPFAVFGLPERYDLDASALERAWLAQTARLHPDLAGSPFDAAQRMAQINEAKKTLEDPERRANALLAHLGGTAKEDDKALPDGFLMEILEVRQEAEQASRGGDAEQVAGLVGWAQDQRGALLEEVGALFHRHGESADGSVLVRVREKLNALRYIERMLEQVGQPG